MLQYNTKPRLILLLYLCIHIHLAQSHEIISRHKRALQFPPLGSGMGLFLALAIPLDIPNRNVFVSYNFEANYGLPYNYSETTYQLTEGVIQPDEVVVQSRQSRSLDRNFTYEILEKKLDSEGLPGRPCLLRTICEASETPLGHNGIVGDVLHVLFTPSSSRKEDIGSDFAIAEKTGKSGDCSEYTADCPTSVLDLVSEVFHY